VKRVLARIAIIGSSIAALLLVIWPSFSTTLIAGAFLGAGYGAFLSVDQALVTQVLPELDPLTKDLGIMKARNNVPQATAPVAPPPHQPVGDRTEPPGKTGLDANQVQGILRHANFDEHHTDPVSG